MRRNRGRGIEPGLGQSRRSCCDCSTPTLYDKRSQPMDLQGYRALSSSKTDRISPFGSMERVLKRPGTQPALEALNCLQKRLCCRPSVGRIWKIDAVRHFEILCCAAFRFSSYAGWRDRLRVMIWECEKLHFESVAHGRPGAPPVAGVMTKRSSGLRWSEASLARNLLQEIPADAVSWVSARISAVLCSAILPLTRCLEDFQSHRNTLHAGRSNSVVPARTRR